MCIQCALYIVIISIIISIIDKCRLRVYSGMYILKMYGIKLDLAVHRARLAWMDNVQVGIILSFSIRVMLIISIAIIYIDI